MREALDAYTFPEMLLSVDRYGKGHINDTFCAVCQSQEGNAIRFIIQRLSLLGVDSPYDYIGRDAFDPTYEGYALFSDGSWISGDIAYDAGTKRVLSITGGEAETSSETLDAMAQKVQQFVRINNLILDTDYYKDNTAAN